MSRQAARRPNILLVGVDSLRADRLSCYGYDRLTTPHLDRLADEGTLFERYRSPHIPTTPGYASMLTGLDCFGTGLVGLRQTALAEGARTLPEILREQGYESSCFGFTGNAASRGFDNYLDVASGWGTLENAPLRKAEAMNDVAQPEIDRLIDSGSPWMVLLRYMDPHSPYLPPPPYDRMFYWGDERRQGARPMAPVMGFAPFRDYFATWMVEGIADADFVIASYDGAVAYMDACIGRLLGQLAARGVLDDTIVVLTADHGETLYDHECWFDHHGLYDCTLHVPLILRYPRRIPQGRRVAGTCQHADLVPTLLELAGIPAEVGAFTGTSLLDLADRRAGTHETGQYITEATWMRKHGWRTPDWKLIVALEPDFHFKPEVELYDLRSDPGEDANLAEKHPEVVADLRGRMEAHIAAREAATGRTNPMFTLLDWHGYAGVGPFKSSQQAYDTLHIGDPAAAARLQANLRGGRTPAAADGKEKPAKAAAKKSPAGAAAKKNAPRAAAAQKKPAAKPRASR